MHRYFPFLVLLLVGSCTEENPAAEGLKLNQDSIEVLVDTSISGNSITGDFSATNHIPIGDSLTYIYLSELPELPLPFQISTEEKYPKTNVTHMNDSIVSLLGHMGSPYGKLLEQTSYAVVVHIQPSDIALPVLYTMDFNGKIIDQLNAFECSGSESEYTCWEYFSVSKTGVIEFTDSTYSYAVDEDRNRIVPERKSLEVTQKTYLINDKGFFKQVEAIE